MKLIGLDNKVRSLNLTPYLNNSVVTNKSQYHLKARQLLQELFPANPIYEEVPLPGTTKSGKMLCADFFLPTQSMIVEVHGEQHYTDNSFFYASRMEFLQAKKRDSNKQEWCEINKLIYIELPYKESLDEWKRRLR